MIALIEPLLPLMVAVPLLVGGALLLIPRHHAARAVLGVITLLGLLGGSVTLVAVTADGSILAHQVALWPGGIAIPFVADAFSSLLLVGTALVATVSFQYMIASRESRSPSIVTLVLVLAGGVAGALLTADLFNLFVFIEVMLLPSYGLLVVLSRRSNMAGARIYVTVNLLASTLFLTGVALIYGVQGTVNLAELAGAAEDPATAVATAVCLAAIAVKAAIFPVHGWLARTYTVTSPAVTALFSGLHTKVAVYAVYRIYSVVFEGESSWLIVLLVLAGVTITVGALAALGEPDMRSILIFQMISGIGYILVGVGLFTQLGLAAGIFYLLHHMIVMGSLLLSTGAIEQTYGSGRLERLGGLRVREPLITAAFVIGALSLAGLPPFSGFVAKFFLVYASAEADALAIGIIAVGISLFALLSVLRIWAAVFNGKQPQDSETQAAEARVRVQHGLLDEEPVGAQEVEREVQEALERVDPPRRASTGEEESHDHRGTRIPLRLALPSLILASISLSLGLGGEVLLALVEQAAAGLLDTGPYVQAVIGR